jgi:putative tryptophan/tyrosine transport system substrate-binding protein
VRRRDFITVITGSAAAWPLVARAQQATGIRRIGLLSPFSPSDTAVWHQTFLRALAELGWVDGKNIIIEYRYAEGHNDRLPALIADLQRLKVDVIVTAVTNDTLAAKNATTVIPIVMAAAGDPVATGIVQSLARPGGNVTGLSQMNPELNGKRLELLRAIAPNVSSVAVLLNLEDSISVLGSNEVQLSAQKIGINPRYWEARNASELNKVLGDATSAGANALVIMPNPIFVVALKRIADFALEKRLPSIFHLREFPAVGGLMSYGVDRNDLFRRAAAYVDKILKGAQPADLPIEQPTKFELVINLKTAKALGLAVPPALLATADGVIE